MTANVAEHEQKDRHQQVATAGASNAAVRIVYLLSRYPAVSHTFFLNEVLALRSIGFEIETASINRSDRNPEKISPEEADEVTNTFYVKSVGIFGVVVAAIGKLFTDPAGFARGLVAACRIGGWEPRAMIFAAFYFVEALVLGRWMRERELAHLHTHFGGPVATVALLTSITWRIPFSITIHGPEEFYDVTKYRLKEKIEAASFVFCISEFCRSQLMLLVESEHWDKMRVLRLGIDPDVFVPALRSGDHVEPQILCVGRLVPAKGQMILLKACRILQERGRAFRLIMVGDGPDRANLESFARDNHLPVVFAGACTHAETRAKLSEADIFVLASFAEGVPVALMEAMAMEVPCVSTVIAGIPELIRSGVDGLLVSPSSVDELAGALDYLLTDQAKRRELGSAGRMRVLDRYNLQINIPLLGKAFRECTQSETGKKG